LHSAGGFEKRLEVGEKTGLRSGSYRRSPGPAGSWYGVGRAPRVRGWRGSGLKGRVGGAARRANVLDVKAFPRVGPEPEKRLVRGSDLGSPGRVGGD